LFRTPPVELLDAYAGGGCPKSALPAEEFILFTAESLSTVLYAIATRYADRAKNMVYVSDELNESERQALREVVEDDDAAPAEQARRLGDALRAMDADRDLVNECYRLAFYLTDTAADLTANPLFAFFVGHRAGRALDKWIHYFAIYHRHLARYRGTSCRLLELGVSRGGSLDMWECYLGSSATLVGVDIDEASQLSNPDRTILLGDQADATFLTSLVENYGPFDVIIDDGGHTMNQQITSVQTLFPGLNDDGIYIVEDCHTSYWEEFDGGLGRPGTFIEWVKQRIDDLHGYHYSTTIDETWTNHVDGIHCYDSVVVLDKKRRFPPFCEQVGGADFIFRQRPASALVGEMLATRDAAIAQRDTVAEDLRVKVNDELRLARGELEDLKQREARFDEELRRLDSELTVTRNDLLDSWKQLQAIRHTLSWRVTAPLRVVRRSRMFARR
jgi:hypothetical protein